MFRPTSDLRSVVQQERSCRRSMLLRCPFPQTRPSIVAEARIFVQSDPKVSVHYRERTVSDGLEGDAIFLFGEEGDLLLDEATGRCALIA